MKIKRNEYDLIGEALIKQVKIQNPDFKLDHLVRLFGRTYSMLIRKLKEEKNDKVQ